MNISVMPASQTANADDNNNGDNICPICHGVFGSHIVRTQCGHRFDLDCITQWFNTLELEDRTCCYCQSTALPLVMESAEPDEPNPYVQGTNGSL
ncbi:hypothetical protein [Endozoicomonas sp. ONNA2]|uniref:hypothetical protein n=1 Tax=Endozoicomonas sp. ONNA2 TaxID=2828741 RepID=UPI002149424F|nr:hypothetical protein [Endozoicomonas sp. ONNA2]